MVAMKNINFLFTSVLALLLITISCNDTIENEDGETQCIDDFLKSIGEDRSLLEAEAENRGIESSDLILEIFSSVVGVADVLFDCSASEQYSKIALESNGKYSEAKSSKDAIHKIEEFTNSIELDSIDLVFLIDATGSMSDDISELRNSLKSIVNSLSNKKINISSAIFRDNNVDSVWYQRNQNELSKSTDEILEFLNQIEAQGGGDLAESMFDATVKTAAEINWQSVGRFLIILTDAPPLTGAESNNSIEDVIDTLIENKVIPLLVLVSLF